MKIFSLLGFSLLFGYASPVRPVLPSAPPVGARDSLHPGIAAGSPGSGVLSIVPRPLRVLPGKGSFLLTNTTVIYTDSALRGVARYCKEYLHDYYGLELSIQTGADRAAMNRTAPARTVETRTGKALQRPGIVLKELVLKPQEGYNLRVSPEEIDIGGNGAGVFYGVQSFLQLIENGKGAVENGKAGAGLTVPCLSIDDQPRFAWRGLSLDVSRHFFTVGTVKKYIDLMAHYKFNVFHWHLVDDEGWRIQIDKYPLLTARGSSMNQWAAEGKFRALDNITGGGNSGFYTKAEVREIVAYARDRFITVLPEIEMPGHSEAAIYAYPEWGVQDSTGETQRQKPVPRVGMYDPSEKVFHFLEDVLTEVMDLFPGQYIHIGGDEADMKKWLKSPVAVALMQKEGMKSEKEVQSYFIRRMEQFILSKGRKLVGWDEILEGGLAPSATVMSWRGEEGGIAAAKMHHPVVMTPLPFVYFDAPQSDDPTEPIGWNYPLSWQHVYQYDPVPSALSAEEAKYVLGAQGNLWAEKVPTPEHLEYMVYPRALALAEDCWTPSSEKELSSFTRRLDHQYELLKLWKVNARLPDVEGLQVVSTNKRDYALALSHPMKDAEIRVTMDGSMPDRQSPLYKGPMNIMVPGSGGGAKGDQAGLGGDSLLIRTLVRSALSDQERTQSLLVKYKPVLPSAGSGKLSPGLSFQSGPIGVSASSPDLPYRAGISGVCGLPDFPGKELPAGFHEIGFKGWLVIDREEDYRIRVDADGETVLCLDGQPVIDNRGYHGTVARESLLHLVKGRYLMSLSYQNEDDEARFIHFSIATGQGAPLDPARLFFHEEGSVPLALTRYVDPFIGTGGHGHTYPGATVPFGMVQLSPDNGEQGWDWSSGYHYSSHTIAGFSHTHLSGTGDGEWCDISVMPALGLIPDTGRFFKTGFSHAREKASPGYYGVELDNGIRVALTATERCGLHEYIFPAGEKEGEKRENPVIRFDLGFHINEDHPVRTYIRRLNDSTLVGYRYSTGWAQSQHIFFAARSSVPFSRIVFSADSIRLADGIDSAGAEELRAQLVFGAPGSGGPAAFDPAAGRGASEKGGSDRGVGTGVRGERRILLKVALSMTNMDKALLALQEIPGWDFEGVRQQAEMKWEKELEKIKINTGDPRLRRIFYTAMYHSCMSPVLYSDADGEYVNAKNERHRPGKTPVRSGSQEMAQRYTLFSLWDTFRALHPLFTVLQPGRLPDILNSMLAFHDENGLLPVWDLGTFETEGMTGYHSIPVLADAILKNVKGIDAERAYRAMKESAHQSIRGTPAYVKYGYLPQDLGGSSVTISLEYAYDDWCIAQVAKKLDRKADYNEFMERSQAYKILFDPGTGFIRAKNADGSRIEPFDPFLAAHGRETQYREGNAWQYSFFVPHDVKGLAGLYGGDQGLIDKLDALFAASPRVTGPDESLDVSGMIGQYAHGNEPSHHIAYLYSFVGAPWKTQEKTRLILDSLYHDGIDGYAGNEDCGQMSAWAIWTMLGLYPANPAGGRYVFGSPMLDEATLSLPDNKTLVFRTIGNSREHPYIRSVKWNGRPYTKSYFDHADLLQGGVLEFEMSGTPDKTRGVKEEDRP